MPKKKGDPHSAIIVLLGNVKLPTRGEIAPAAEHSCVTLNLKNGQKKSLHFKAKNRYTAVCRLCSKAGLIKCKMRTTTMKKFAWAIPLQSSML